MSSEAVVRAVGDKPCKPQDTGAARFVASSWLDRRFVIQVRSQVVCRIAAFVSLPSSAFTIDSLRSN